MSKFAVEDILVLSAVGSCLVMLAGCDSFTLEDRDNREALVEYTFRWGECTTSLYECNKAQTAAPDGTDCGGIYEACIQNNKDNLFVRAPDGGCSEGLISCYGASTSAAQSEECRNDMGDCASWYDAGCTNPCFDAFNTCKAAAGSDPDLNIACVDTQIDCVIACL